MASSFTPEMLAKLHSNTSHIRNMCILAHVDHGKTTLADSLLASNGIISTRMSGKLRYLDSREDEQTRGITMKSSAVTLLHKADGEPYVINVIDSPGHVDFSSEVSTAVRLSDGAVILVDVVEGVSAQTHAVLRQAWAENITPVLVINKIDRLILELKMTPAEAYEQLLRVLEQVNAVTATLFTTSVIERLDEQPDDMIEDEIVDQDDSGLYFEPERGNVIFASAIDGWGFTVHDFAAIVAARLGCGVGALQRCLWGDYYVAKEKTGMKVRKGAYGKGKAPLFVKFVLEPVWSMYQVVVEEMNREKMKKMTAALNIKVSARDWQSDPKVLLQSIMSRWLPLSACVLNVVAKKLPAPTDMTEERVKSLLFASKAAAKDVPKEVQPILDAMLKCAPLPQHDAGDGDGDNSGDTSAQTEPCVAFVSKMVAFERAMLPENQAPRASAEELRRRRAEVLARRQRVAALVGDSGAQGEEESMRLVQQVSEDATARGDAGQSGGGQEEEGEESSKWMFLAYTRVFAGTIRPGQKIHVLGPRYDPRRPDQHRTEVVVGSIYLLMGRSLLALNEAPAGTVVGIAGLEGHVLKTATLATTPACPRLRGLYEHTKPIVRVALETERISDMPALHRGMQMLNKADPCVEVFVQETGELVLVAAGEVHIERCLTDLRETFCPGISIKVSPPIVPFRETIVPPPTTDVTNEAIGAENARGERRCYLLPDDVDVDDDGIIVSVKTTTKRWTIKVRTRPLPASVTAILQDHPGLLRELSLAMSDRARELSRWVRETKKQGGGDEEETAAPGEQSDAEHEHATAHHVVDDDDGDGEGDGGDGEQADGGAKSGEIASAGETSGKESPDVKDDSIDVSDELVDHSTMTAEELYEQLKAAFEAEGREWAGVQDTIASFGPRHSGTNILTTSPGLPYPNVFGSKVGQNVSTWAKELLSHLNPLIVSFQLVTQTGPLCEEPMMGVCFDVVDIQVDESVPYSSRQFSGQVISAMQDACRQAFLVRDVRLMTAVYSCDLLVNSGSLGKVYGVINKRNGKVISEEMREGSDSFQIKAKLPVTHSFGFAEELRKRTSGLAVPQLVFSHWEVIDEDPFWVPTTEEEKAHFGEKGDAPNLARKYMDDTRKRKGLYVERKIVEFAEKQRTITRNK
ncbi:hypothetical protein PTSG_11989 [Salpingoeca rosetta]|uniref:Ribosome assembly protein 1 n=1 Tax=Salpingoeca rosetta (strain ATCC 50818 / BSB-021) TaxID=946362 RepID=F2U4R1_SALR5|nr:uncharacterized protein PTSG_11989 [Salpingoeca rosetta]EGD82627.1 hypothetical protein PTSG_11989 [Salpingoeca rosetta]|eukprot:XP_004995863.1 hypothetical protein PTSG_11989 [Salpingoeca rosetta]